MHDSSKKEKTGDCNVKQRHTTHWDMDYLTREEVDQLMRQPRSGPAPEEKRLDAAEGPDSTPNEDPVRIGLMLLAGAAAMMVTGVLLLRI
jgi:hypothetical protein